MTDPKTGKEYISNVFTSSQKMSLKLFPSTSSTMRGTGGASNGVVSDVRVGAAPMQATGTVGISLRAYGCSSSLKSSSVADACPPEST